MITLIRLLFRTILGLTSLCTAILGVHGVYSFLFKENILPSTNSELLFLKWHIPNDFISRIIHEVTTQASDSILLPIVLLIVGVIAWVTQMGIAKKSLYHRIRFSKPSQTSPVAWLIAIAGIAVFVYIAMNWNSMDHTIAILVIIANTTAIAWNFSR